MKLATKSLVRFFISRVFIHMKFYYRCNRSLQYIHRENPRHFNLFAVGIDLDK